MSNHQGGFSGALAGTWVLKVPHTENSLHVSPGAAAAGHTYWRVSEGREEHYLTLDSDGGISIYDPATNMVSMEGYKH